MGALLDHAAGVQHLDPVGMGDGREAVRHDERGLALRQPVERAFDLVFRLLVKRRGGLAQEQDRGFPQEGAGDGEHETVFRPEIRMKRRNLELAVDLFEVMFGSNNTEMRSAVKNTPLLYLYLILYI